MATPTKPQAPGDWYYDGSANRWINRKTGKADMNAATRDRQVVSPPIRGERASEVPRPLNARMEAQRMQQFLKNRGYNIMVDGIIGPRTKSALADWHKGKGVRNPGGWSQSVAPVDEVRPGVKTNNGQNPAPSRPAPPKDVPKGAPKLGVDYGKHSFYQPVVGTQKPVVTGKGRPNLPGVPANNMPGGQNSFDVDVLANAQMEAKYGPVLAEYLRQEQNVRNMADNRVAEIGDMYGMYTKGIDTRNQEATAFRGTMAAATEGLAPAIAAGIALDPQAAAELANRGDIESDYAQQMAGSAGDFDRRLAGAAQAGGVFAAGQERAEAAGKIGELGAERKDTLAQRGADLVATRQALTEWQADQFFRQRELALNERSTNASIADAQIKNRISIAELKAANAMLPLEAQKTAAELAQLYANIEQTTKETAMLGQPEPMSPKDVSAEQKAKQDRKNSVLNNMYAQTRHEDGKWRVSLTKTWQRAKAAMRSQGVDPDSPTGKKWLKEFADMNGITLGKRGNPVQREGDKK